jgi:hypothetical protein
MKNYKTKIEIKPGFINHKETPSGASRRDFLKATGLTGVGLMLGFSSFGKEAKVQNLSKGALLDLEINPFIIIRTDGQISLINPRIGSEP